MKVVASVCLSATFLSLPGRVCAATREAQKVAHTILHESGISGGLIVHVGCGRGDLTAALRTSDSYIVHGLDTERSSVRAARKFLLERGLGGSASVDHFDGRYLPYTDDLVNLLVLSETYDVPKDEALRVLAPGGVMLVREGREWTKTVKPWPESIDEWTHYLHGPDNNAVAQDTVIGPPRHMQWLADPLWARNHHRLASISSVVTARGRLFYIVDEATSANMGVPGKWSIVARDAFSGVRLWRKRIDSWAWQGYRFRSGPPQLARLLVTSGDRVYAPLGLNAPVSQMDVVTGQTLKTYESTVGAEEIVLVRGILLVLKGSPVAEQAVGHVAFKRRYLFPNEKEIIAVRAEDGETLWQWSQPDANPKPETLASDGKRVYFQVGEGVVCLDLESGRQLWSYGQRAKSRRRKKLTFGVHTLVVSDDVVLCKLSGKLTALSARAGKKLWECSAGSGFHAPVDVFVIDGRVWQGMHVSDSVAPPPVHDFDVARDLRTGEILARNAVMVDLQTSGHHHRCYREKATLRYIMTGKRGIEMMDLAGEDHSRNNWVRGACQYGILPANGLIYAPSHACGCYMESKLYGFWALAAERPVVNAACRRVPDDKRLERGPAFGKQTGSGRPDAESWPVYRHDPLRSGVASTVLSSDLRPSWKATLSGKLTQPVVADDKVFVASTDDHVVYALDTKSGRTIWKHTAGGRVDSPPAYYQGKLYFGSADGRVTCLRAADGESIWCFFAAPADLRTVARDQVESLWPVHGSVLILGGVVYCPAGRSTWIDGGIDLYGLDPATGSILHKTRFETEHPQFQQGKDQAKPEYETKIAQTTTDYKTFLQPDRSDSFSMAGGCLSDVLVSDGTNVYMHHVKFNAELQRREERSRHLFSTSNLLDDKENHRSHWVLGTGDFSRIPVAYSWIANRRWLRGAVLAVPAGVMLVYDDRAVWGVRRQGDANGKYDLFEKANKPFSPQEESLPDFRKIPKNQFDKCVWKRDLPVRVRAMLKSGNHLFMGAMPIAIPPEDPYAAYEGRTGGMIVIASTKDGARVAEYKLDHPVVWDGMAAAHGRLYLSTTDGTVRCFSPSQ